MSEVQFDKLKSVYDQLCTSYRAIDDFRTKLLGFLPLASGAGVFFLLGSVFDDPTKRAFYTPYLLPIGIFGFVVTLGLFSFEIYGIRKCHALIKAGQQIERALGIDGQFIHRPREVARVINEPFAAGIIYPAVLAGWLYIALLAVLPLYAGWIAVVVFLAGFAGTLYYSIHLKSEDKTETIISLNQ
jgi:hypothetical protein